MDSARSVLRMCQIRPKNRAYSHSFQPWNKDKLLNGVSAMLAKKFDASVGIVRMGFADCKKECAIQQQIRRRVKKATKPAKEEMTIQ